MRELKIPIVVGVVTLFLLALGTVVTGFLGTNKEGAVQVYFLDIGQGDATLIESPTGTQVLIDGGRGGVVLDRLREALGFFDRDIDMVIATHPDMDHIGGLVDVLERYNVHTIVMTENESDTPAFLTFKKRVLEEGAEILFARRRQQYYLGSGASGSTTLTILFPDRDPSLLESNTASIVARLTYGESEFLFTGDSPQAIEEYLVGLGESLQSDVLKAGHHGSRTSSSELFVGAVQPHYAIISAGRDNTYGHPHKEVLEIFDHHAIQVLRTDEVGTIHMDSDGKVIILVE